MVGWVGGGEVCGTHEDVNVPSHTVAVSSLITRPPLVSVPLSFLDHLGADREGPGARL